MSPELEEVWTTVTVEAAIVPVAATNVVTTPPFPESEDGPIPGDWLIEWATSQLSTKDRVAFLLESAPNGDNIINDKHAFSFVFFIKAGMQVE